MQEKRSERHHNGTERREARQNVLAGNVKAIADGPVSKKVDKKTGKETYDYSGYAYPAARVTKSKDVGKLLKAEQRTRKARVKASREARILQLQGITAKPESKQKIDELLRARTKQLDEAGIPGRPNLSRRERHYMNRTRRRALRFRGGFFFGQDKQRERVNKLLELEPSGSVYKYRKWQGSRAKESAERLREARAYRVEEHGQRQSVRQVRRQVLKELHAADAKAWNERHTDTLQVAKEESKRRKDFRKLARYQNQLYDDYLTQQWKGVRAQKKAGNAARAAAQASEAQASGDLTDDSHNQNIDNLFDE